MIPFNLYPYTNFHALNLDWVLNELREIQETIEKYNLRGVLPAPEEGDDGKVAMISGNTWIASDLYPEKISSLEGDNIVFKGNFATINARLDEIYAGITEATTVLNGILRTAV